MQNMPLQRPRQAKTQPGDENVGGGDGRRSTQKQAPGSHAIPRERVAAEEGRRR
eukprot:CAMPEP_0195608476 /NCGR_PEP_ID=MMETSP0815-20121206/8760_1 /TAXON_ID=97485 /ORGANISM="Prymnesium parvum, Strain Texoma1" /LENGTH=53 /DNA_ID=CAMNT_0040748329 /DNA_START=287 /DNA_END=448 /DNA_ORIENTATION=-